MRYKNIPAIPFTDSNGNQYQVNDLREYPIYTPAFEQKLQAGDAVDEIASRPDVFGDDGEMSAYAIFEANITSFVENRWSLPAVRSINIPLLTTV